MKFRNLLFAMFITSAFCSCTTYTRMVQSSPVIARNVELDPIKADIEVHQDQKLTGEGVVKYFLCFQINGFKEQKMVEGITYSQSEPGLLTNRGKDKARSIAAYQALESCPDCDVLVHPKYEVTINKSPLGILYRKYTVRVSGYGATYKNFRTEKEIKIIGNDNKEYIVIEEND